MSLEENALPQVAHVEITEDNCDQRLDNFLITRLKGVPKSHIYRIVRKGEVRVNKGRVDVKYRLLAGDIVRIPPVRVAERSEESYVPQGLQAALQQGILFEDEGFFYCCPHLLQRTKLARYHSTPAWLITATFGLSPRTGIRG